MHLIRKFLNRAVGLNNWFLFVGTIIFLGFSVIILCSIEPQTFTDPFTALWYLMTTVTTVGYGDVYPETTGGRLYAMVVYIIGIGLVGVVIGKVVDAFGTYRRKREAGLLQYHGSDHIVIIGWSPKSEMAVEELVDADNKGNIVVVARLPEAPLLSDRIHYINGKATDDETLKKAAVERAKSVIVFADETIKDQQLTDGKTLLIVTSIESYAPQVHTMVEITDAAHVKNFRHAKVDEFILPYDMVSRMAVQSVLTHGVTSVYNHLLSNRLPGSIYRTNKRPEWETYGDAAKALLKQNAILIASGDQLSVNNRPDDAIPDGEQLYIISDKATYHTL